jgi:hypothetical protein
MSVFVGWHTLAIVIAPAPDNNMTGRLHLLLQPYLTLFSLDTRWDFFAPDVSGKNQFRYVVRDSAGKEQTFTPSDELSRLSPSFNWFRLWYVSVMDSPELHGNFIAAFFCRKHAALRPDSITLLEIQENYFWPRDHLNGKHPLDSEFVAVNTLKRVTCPK